MSRENESHVAKDIMIYILKILLVILLMFVAFFVGAMIGFSLVGDGGNPLQVFNPEMWNHILRFIF